MTWFAGTTPAGMEQTQARLGRVELARFLSSTLFAAARVLGQEAEADDRDAMSAAADVLDPPSLKSSSWLVSERQQTAWLIRAAFRDALLAGPVSSVDPEAEISTVARSLRSLAAGSASPSDLTSMLDVVRRASEQFTPEDAVRTAAAIRSEESLE